MRRVFIITVSFSRRVSFQFVLVMQPAEDVSGRDMSIRRQLVPTSVWCGSGSRFANAPATCYCGYRRRRDLDGPVANRHSDGLLPPYAWSPLNVGKSRTL